MRGTEREVRSYELLVQLAGVTAHSARADTGRSYRRRTPPADLPLAARPGATAVLCVAPDRARGLHRHFVCPAMDDLTTPGILRLVVCITMRSALIDSRKRRVQPR